MIQAIVFDFDGVLANSEPTHLAALTEVLAGIGVQLDPADYFSRYLGLDDEGAFRAVASDRGFELDPRAVDDLIRRKAAIFDQMIASGNVLFPGARECVERLSARFPLGIASGALRHEIEDILSRNHLDSHFRFIVASGETANSKPHPDPYRRASELHGLPPSTCLAIEDSRWGIESAKAAGLACVGITHTYPATELTAADAVVDSLEAFTETLIRSL